MKKVNKFKVVVHYNDCPGIKGYFFFVLEKRRSYVQHYPKNRDYYLNYQDAEKAGKQLIKKLKFSIKTKTPISVNEVYAITLPPKKDRTKR